MQPRLAGTPLAELLAARIREGGSLPFASYMAECLYHPQHGYYNSPAAAHRIRDYYTSVDVHPVFGRLLARQLAEMWEILGRPRPFLAAELGAATGALAAQILDFTARALPDFSAALRYVAVEQSAVRRRALEQRHAASLASERLFSVDVLPPQIPAGCVFSNEFFDALPVRRLICMQGQLRELHVTSGPAGFADHVGPPEDPAISEYFAREGIALEEGQQVEVSPAAGDWMGEIGRSLQRGFVLTIDYGHPARQLYNQHHFRGTLLAYRDHRAEENFYAAPGQQDLTAHVDFTALEEAGARAGLEKTGMVSQAGFLLALGRGNDFADLCEPGESETVRLKSRLQLKTLIYPEGMGETFSVLVQHKGVADPRLTGLQPL